MTRTSLFVLISDLPPGSIVVNHKDQISYAINPKEGTIEAIWLGESLDIGPNIYARGRHSSKFLGKHLFPPRRLELLIDGQRASLKFVGYEKADKPKFMFTYNDVK